MKELPEAEIMEFIEQLEKAGFTYGEEGDTILEEDGSQWMVIRKARRGWVFPSKVKEV